MEALTLTLLNALTASGEVGQGAEKTLDTVKNTIIQCSTGRIEAGESLRGNPFPFLG